MRATAKFLNEIQGSHTVYSYCDVISPTGNRQRLIVTDGYVSVDRTANIRRAGHVSCIDPDGVFVPDGTRGVLTPFGTEVRPYRGVKYADGIIETYPLGVFRLSKVQLHETVKGNIAIALDFFDLSRTVARDKFVTTYTIDNGTNIVTAIYAILARTFPNVSYDAISSALATTAPKVYNPGGDPWAACQDLAKSVGCEIYFNVEGAVVIAPTVDLDTHPTPAFAYIEGPGCTMTDLTADFTDDPGFNGVVVTGASPGNSDPPVRAEAWDYEPSSPTYRYGPYGEVPMFQTDSNIKTTSDAQTMADSLLRAQLGYAAQLQVTSWVNPVLEGGDVISVQRNVLGVTGLYAVDSFTVPLKKDAYQTLKLRTKRILS